MSRSLDVRALRSRSRSRSGDRSSWRGGPPQNRRKLQMMERTGAFASRSEERRRREKLKKSKDGGRERPGLRRLADEERRELSRLLGGLVPEVRTILRGAILRVMCWCLDHSDCAVDVARILVDALMADGLGLEEHLVRLYLLSDVVHNSGSARQPSAWYYRREFETQLPCVFEWLHLRYRGEASILMAEKVGEQVVQVLRSWQERAVFSSEYVKGLEAAFFSDVAQADTFASHTESNSGEAGLSSRVRRKLIDWQSQHFSQLQKIGKARGLNWQAPQHADGRCVEDAQKNWILDRLLMYDLYAEEESHRRAEAAMRRATISDSCETLRVPPAASGPIPGDLDGESLSSGDEGELAAAGAEAGEPTGCVFQFAHLD